MCSFGGINNGFFVWECICSFESGRIKNIFVYIVVVIIIIGCCCCWGCVVGRVFVSIIIIVVVIGFCRIIDYCDFGVIVRFVIIFFVIVVVVYCF